MRKLLNSALAIIAFVGGFTAAAHLHVFQPRQPRQLLAAPQSASPHPAAPQSATPDNLAIRPPAFQRGIDIDAYTYPNQDFSAAVTAVVDYVKALNANSVSISFPIFMANRESSTVFASPRTPTPAQMGLFIADAERAGLYVSLRPLLSEFQIGGNRTIWQPANMSAWFAGYQRFLLPYARVAQASKAGMFIVGAEFAKFGSSPLWDRLDRGLAKVFHGRLAYANNGSGNLSQSTGGRYAFKTVDAYPPIDPPFLNGWTAYDRTLPTGAILSEVGIAAWDGAWQAPWQHRLQQQRFDPEVQGNWFSAACQAAKETGLGGIYFWTLGLQEKFPITSTAHPGAWAHSVGATAITRCFETTASG